METVKDVPEQGTEVHQTEVVIGQKVYSVTFRNPGHAATAARGQGDWGGDKLVNTSYFFEDLSQYDAWRKEQVRKTAMFKLSREEKIALGLIT